MNIAVYQIRASRGHKSVDLYFGSMTVAAAALHELRERGYTVSDKYPCHIRAETNVKQAVETAALGTS
jgi:hypothetical protein